MDPTSIAHDGAERGQAAECQSPRHRVAVRPLLMATASALLILCVVGCSTGQGLISGSGATGLYGEVDLLRIHSDRPPPPPRRDLDRYFQDN